MRKFEMELFGDGGLGRLRHCKPAHIKLKSGAIPYKGWYYNLPKAYEDVAMKEIQLMVNIGVLKELIVWWQSLGIAFLWYTKENWRHTDCNRFQWTEQVCRGRSVSTSADQWDAAESRKNQVCNCARFISWFLFHSTWSRKPEDM